MKKLIYHTLLYLTRFLSPESKFNFGKRLLIDLSKQNGADSHVGIRRKIYKHFLRNYPINYSYELGRFYGLFSWVKAIEKVDGDIVEFGVGNGKSMFAWASALKYFDINKTIYGFDSFEGFPDAHPNDIGTRVKFVGKKVEGWTHIPGPDYITNFIIQDHGNDGMESLFATGLPDIKLVKGYFDQTIDQVPEKIALLHLDADMYESTKTPLQKCLSKMSKGGVIIFDEYHEFDRWPGVKKAVDEVCVPLGYIPEFDKLTGRYIIKT